MIDCKSIATKIKDDLKESIKGKHVGLAIIQVGDNPASNKYVQNKLKDAEEIGIDAELIKIPENATEQEVVSQIEIANGNERFDGIILQLPLPKHMDEDRLVSLINVDKDVDGFIKKSEFVPCTPKGVLTLLDEMSVDLVGSKVTLVGYGNLVNKPLMQLLSDKGATVTVCRSKTPMQTLRDYCKMSDIIVTATGSHNLINSTCINFANPPIIIDCGISVINGKQYGDVSETIYEEIENVTPRVNGMGLMTRVSLMQNVVKAAMK